MNKTKKIVILVSIGSVTVFLALFLLLQETPCEQEIAEFLKNQEMKMISPQNQTTSGLAQPVWESQEQKEEFARMVEDCTGKTVNWD